MSALPHFCPNCGYEYESWIEICPDCGVLVKPVNDKDAHSKLETVNGANAGEDPKWTVVTNVPNAIIGSFIKSQLEDAGIPALMMRAPSADIAQFSGNDYVPHVLLVPLNKKEEARSLIDSRPDNGPGDAYWSQDYPSEEEAADWSDDDVPAADVTDLRRLWGPDNATENAAADRKLPEGWTLLPTENDVRQRTEHQRAHQDPQAWHWQGPGAPAASTESASTDDDLPYRPSRALPTHTYNHDPSDYNNDDAQWTGPSKWIRIFYGILLLALSLPFIFQLLTQLTSIFK